jgi:precorrin-2/cobalt-factor-2 C20-methyltransferase
MSKGKLYGVGVGPGESDLITLKAYRLIQDADKIICPSRKKGVKSIALQIIEPHLTEKSELVEMEFPMIAIEANREELEAKWQENAQEINSYLEAGDNVVFITLGDAMVFSTYAYVLDFLLEEGIDVETVSGIPSFCNLAAKINVSLTQGEESLAVTSMTQSIEEIRAILDIHDNIVIMKVSAGSEIIAEELEKRGLENNFTLISNIGMETENKTTDINDLKQKIPYLSTMLIKKNVKFN